MYVWAFMPPTVNLSLMGLQLLIWVCSFPDRKSGVGLCTDAGAATQAITYIFTQLDVCELGFMPLYSMCAHMRPVTHPVVQKMTQSDLSLD